MKFEIEKGGSLISVCWTMMIHLPDYWLYYLALRCEDEGIPIAVRYFAIVRRLTAIPI